MADLRSRNAFKSLPQRNALISIFNGFGFTSQFCIGCEFAMQLLMDLILHRTKSKGIMRSTFKTVFLCKRKQGERTELSLIKGRVTINGTIAHFSCKPERDQGDMGCQGQQSPKAEARKPTR